MARDRPQKPGRLPLALSFIIVCLGAVLLPRQWARYKSATVQVDRSRQIIETSQAYLSSLKDAETSQRGYLLTGDNYYLQPYDQSIAQLPLYLRELRPLIGDDPSLKGDFEQLQKLTQKKLDDMAHTLTLENDEGYRTALAVVRTDRGEALMQQIRRLVSAIDRDQAEELNGWIHSAEQSGKHAIVFGTTGLALLFIFLLSSTIASWRARERELRLVKAERDAFNALQESELRFRSVADSAPVMIWVSGPDQKCIYLNKRWLEFTGRTIEQELKGSWADGVHPDDLPRASEIYKRAFELREPFKLEYRLRRHDGEYRWVVDHGVPRFLPNGDFIGYIGSCVDIHDRKTLEEKLEERVRERTEQLRYKEEELMQSRKIEAIGRLAGGVAHDFNNLLTGIFGISQEIRDDLPADDPHREGLEEILKAAQRAGALTKQLLAFGRRQIVTPVVLNVNTILGEMTGMLRRLIGEDVHLRTLLCPEAGHVRIDPGQLEQIVINLVINGRDAMPHGGELTIETANVELDANYGKNHFDVLPGPYVLLAISDNGVGMDENTLEHAFEPFFTTKEKGRGSGMGLATVYGIVKQNNGDIFLYSAPGAGTTFKIYLPRTDQAVAAQPPASVPLGLSGKETILLVEDEDIVRRMASKALHRAGYKVLEARNGNEALEISATFNDPIDLLLTDVIMPGLNGRQVAELLTPQRPSMKVLYTSGYTENIIAQRGMLKPGIAFIEKSFTASAICSKVREILDLS